MDLLNETVCGDFTEQLHTLKELIHEISYIYRKIVSLG